MQSNAVGFDRDDEEAPAVGLDQRRDDVLANLENLLARDAALRGYHTMSSDRCLPRTDPQTCAA